MNPGALFTIAYRRHCMTRGILLALTLWAPALAAQTMPVDCEPNTASCGAAAPTSSAQMQPDTLDWVAYQLLPENQKQARAMHCGGAYVDPLAAVDTSIDPSTQEILGSADSSELQGNLVRLEGDVSLNQGYRQLRSDRAEYDRSNGTGTMNGNVEFREPGALLRGESAWVDTNTGEARLDNGHFLMHEQHGRGSAEQIYRRADEIIELESAAYSYCPPSAEFWSLISKELELDTEAGTGTARSARLELKGTPVFYFPYLQFPIDDRRKSGFLWPEFGRDSSGGVDFAVPYYLNLAPNYDLLLTPRLIADRGAQAEVQARYLGTWLGLWDFGVSYIDGDKRYKDENPGTSGDRWLGSIDQRGLVNDRWRSEIDYTEISDIDYLADIGTSSLDVRQNTHLDQLARMNYLGDNWEAEIRFQQFQTIDKDIVNKPYKKLPEIALDHVRRQKDFSPNVLFKSRLTAFDHQTLQTGERLFNEAGVNYPMSWIWGNLTPTIKYRHINYNLDKQFLNDGEDNNPSVGAPLASIDGSLFFERDMDWGGKRFLHTLEPQVFYLWADYEEQDDLPNFDTRELTFSYGQLFRDTRFAGYDRIDDANQVSVGITTRLIDQETGNQTLRASIGQIHYFDDRLVNDGTPEIDNMEGSSSIAAQFGMEPTNALSFDSSWLFNTNTNELDQTNARVSYMAPKGRIFNLGYSFRRANDTGVVNANQDISQVDFSTYLPIADNWGVFFQALYDLDEKDSINDIFGIEYNDCCWRLRLVHQRSLNQVSGSTVVGSDVETKQATYVEFQLKGLGGVGTRVTKVLEEFIRGYESEDD
ncbi:LPS-assembly protein LptD [Candidatus Litorirhabdus singularis]|nr:LPS-assembly protein LptD [Candidatus Litorirhabdus singularis]